MSTTEDDQTGRLDGSDPQPSTAEADLISEIRRRRTAAGLSQAKLATLTGYSFEHVSRAERAGRGLASANVIHAIDKALHADGALIALRARADASRRSRREVEPAASPPCVSQGRDFLTVPVLEVAISKIRSAMREVSFPSGQDAGGYGSHPLPVAALQDEVRMAWQEWHSSRAQRTKVSLVLPSLIHEAHATIRNASSVIDRRRSCATAADLYRLVQRFLAHICEPALHELAVERGRTFSELADSPMQFALATWSSAISFSAAGDFDEAIRVARLGLCAVEGSVINSDSLEANGIYGALSLELAAAYGFAGRTEAADTCLKSATAAGTQLPQGYHHSQSGFETGCVAVVAAILLGDRGSWSESIRVSERLDPFEIGSLVRRSRLLLEAALAHSRERDPFAAVHYLREAANVSLEAVGLIPWAQTLADEVVEMSPPALIAEARTQAIRLKSLAGTTSN